MVLHWNDESNYLVYGLLFPGAIISFVDIVMNVTEGDVSTFSLCIELRDDGDGLQRPVDFTITLESGNPLLFLSVLSFSHSFMHTQALLVSNNQELQTSLWIFVPIGTADVIRDISLTTEFITIEPLDNGFSADLQFLPNNATALYLDFTVVDDDFIESSERFQASLRPALTEFDSTTISANFIYIADNDG